MKKIEDYKSKEDAQIAEVVNAKLNGGFHITEEDVAWIRAAAETLLFHTIRIDLDNVEKIANYINNYQISLTIANDANRYCVFKEIDVLEDGFESVDIVAVRFDEEGNKYSITCLTEDEKKELDDFFTLPKLLSKKEDKTYEDDLDAAIEDGIVQQLLTQVKMHYVQQETEHDGYVAKDKNLAFCNRIQKELEEYKEILKKDPKEINGIFKINYLCVAQ